MLFGLAVGLLTFASSAWAEGLIVRWDQIVGNAALSASTQVTVARNIPGRLYRVSDGRVVLNLETGDVWIRVHGMSRAYQREGAALGSNSDGGIAIGALVCNSFDAAPTEIRTGEFAFDEGDVSYHGVLTLTEDCRQSPDALVFLVKLKTTNSDPYLLHYHAYGADRHIQQ